METETFGTGLCFSELCRSLSIPFPEFDLGWLIEKMKLGKNWKKGDLDALVLLNSPARQILLTILHEGTEINSFQANDSVNIKILEGEIYFKTPRESVSLYRGQELTIHEKFKYNLTTRAETVLLLTLLNGTPEPE